MHLENMNTMLSKTEVLAFPFKTNFESSLIHGIYHDKILQRLFVKFKNNQVYSYAPFTEENYLELITDSRGVGKFFHHEVKGNSNYIYHKHYE